MTAPIKRDPAVNAALVALVGTCITAAATVGSAYAKIDPGVDAGPTDVNCLEVLQRYDRYLAEHPGSIELFRAQPGSVGLLRSDASARRCGLTPEVIGILDRTRPP